MKYQIAGGGWPVGARLIEAGTIIDTSTLEWASLAWVPPPMDAIALDQAQVWLRLEEQSDDDPVERRG
jgi:hypothetical protein